MWWRPEEFTFSDVVLERWHERTSLVSASEVLPLSHRPFSGDGVPSYLRGLYLEQFPERIVEARRRGKPVIFFLGGHVIKRGLSRFIMAMLREGWITHLAGNGAVLVHDWELTTKGETSEDVAEYLPAGRFGLWDATHWGICQSVRAATAGLATQIGHELVQRVVQEPEMGILRAAYAYRVPASIHLLIGGDVIAGPHFDGAVMGEATWRDFRIFANAVAQLHGGGVFCNFGSAVHGPELFLKALSLARNAERKRTGCETPITTFSTAVFDLLPADWMAGVPTTTDPLYYYRPLKTLLWRAVMDGGDSYYFQSDHQDSIPYIYHRLQELEHGASHHDRTTDGSTCTTE